MRESLLWDFLSLCDDNNIFLSEEDLFNIAPMNDEDLLELAHQIAIYLQEVSDQGEQMLDIYAPSMSTIRRSFASRIKR